VLNRRFAKQACTLQALSAIYVSVGHAHRPSYAAAGVNITQKTNVFWVFLKFWSFCNIQVSKEIPRVLKPLKKLSKSML